MLFRSLLGSPQIQAYYVQSVVSSLSHSNEQRVGQSIFVLSLRIAPGRSLSGSNCSFSLEIAAFLVYLLIRLGRTSVSVSLWGLRSVTEQGRTMRPPLAWPPQEDANEHVEETRLRVSFPTFIPQGTSLSPAPYFVKAASQESSQPQNLCSADPRHLIIRLSICKRYLCVSISCSDGTQSNPQGQSPLWGQD